jgi:hypothetical protein
LLQCGSQLLTLVKGKARKEQAANDYHEREQPDLTEGSIYIFWFGKHSRSYLAVVHFEFVGLIPVSLIEVSRGGAVRGHGLAEFTNLIS